MKDNNKAFIGLLGLLLALSVMGSIGGGSSGGSADRVAETAVETSEAETRIVSYDGANIEVPSEWEEKDADNGKYVYPSYGGLVYLRSYDYTLTASSADEAFASLVAGLEGNEQTIVSESAETFTIGEAVAFRTGMTLQTDDQLFVGEVELVLTDGKVYIVAFMIPESSYEQHSEDVEFVLGSIELEEPTAPVFVGESDSEDAKENDAESTEAALADEQDADGTKDAEGDDAAAAEQESPSEPDAEDAEEEAATTTTYYPMTSSRNINVENNEEFAHLLTIADPAAPEVAEFAEEHAGSVIEFDGVVAYCMPHGTYKTRFDYLIYAGDDYESAPTGPNFMFEDVSYSDFNWEGDKPDVVPAGLRLHIVARVVEYDSDSQIFYLDPVETSLRY